MMVEIALKRKEKQYQDNLLLYRSFKETAGT